MGCTFSAHAQRPTEYQVKAAFLYNFAKFVEWPAETFEDSEDPIVIGILGEDPFRTTLEETVQDQSVRDRELKILRFASAADLEACHILFVASSEKPGLRTLLSRLDGSSVLTVGETSGFCETGGMISFYLERNRVRFEINPDACERAGLKMSAKLLRLARIVRDRRRKEK